MRLTGHSNNPIWESGREELSREKLEVDTGTFLDLVAYRIENYGFAEIVENREGTNAGFRRARSMMPFQYLDAKPGDFKWGLYNADIEKQKKIANYFVLHYEEFKKKGYGLFIYSSAKGSGKTFLSCCLTNGALERRDLCPKFISTPDFLEETRKKYRGEDAREELFAIRDADPLIIDDIGVEMKKDWTDEELFKLIDHRYNRKLVTVFTSNCKVNELRLNERVAARINWMCIPLELPEVSIRDMKAQKEHSDFLEGLKNAHTGAPTPA